MSQTTTPTLENCDREPIHIPGSIQPHGALLAFDHAGRLTHRSSNAQALLGAQLPFGSRIGSETFADAGQPQPATFQAIEEALQRSRAARALATRINGAEFDVVLRHDGVRLICEFERREAGADLATFAQLAFASLEGLKQSLGIQELLDLAVVAVRELTGFDRVMAYRFDQDDSGEIVAEAKADALEAFLGRHYPASDIPAQARRLYVLNTLRLIADVAYRPVPIEAAPAEKEPLDLSHSVLRSVSPIHVEYLTNMGVHGSMSVSIVVGGKLWGMIACHHQASKLVPYPVRMAADVMAQVIASTLASIAARERETAMAQAALVRSEAVTGIAGGMEVLEVFRRDHPALMQTLSADAVVACLDGVPRLTEGADVEWLRQLSLWLEAQPQGLVQVVDARELPAWDPAVPREARFCGVLALRFDETRHGWLIALRRERVMTIRWGGKPDKVIAHGPLGPRLTPRGSFDEWRETVRDRASPWSPIELEIATLFMDSVRRAYAQRAVEQDAMRAQVWAMLGHDLRNPLQSLSIAHQGIQRGVNPDRLNTIIRNSTQRMNRLLSDVLDISRLQHGSGLTFDMAGVDLAELLRQLVDESALAHPTVGLTTEIPEALRVHGDAGRLAQLFANLLSNARHHGRGDVGLQAGIDGDRVVVRVSNEAEPIPDDIAATLFQPFKRTSMNNLRNRTGMGLGLYIAAQVAEGHGGSLRYEFVDGRVNFVVELQPEQPGAAFKA